VMVPELDNLAKREGSVVVKENRLRTVLRVRSDAGPLYVKRFRAKNVLGHLKTLFVPSKAQNEWANTMRIYASGIATARPAFVAERRRLGAVSDSLVGFYEVPGSRCYARVLDEARQLPPVESEKERQRLLHQVA